MEVLCRIMGVIAVINQRVSRIRVNLFPINLLIIIFLGMWLYHAANNLFQAVSNTGAPHPIRYSEMLSHTEWQRSYVAVTGDLHPEAAVTVQKDNSSGDSTDDRYIYVPFTNGQTRSAVLVRFDTTKRVTVRDRVQVQLSGMAKTMPDEMATMLSNRGQLIDGYLINTRVYFQVGEQPGNPYLLELLTLLALLLFSGFVVNYCQQYIVFRYTGREVQPGAQREELAENELIITRVTGSFLFANKTIRRFLHVPALMTHLRSGERTFISNIDASSRFFGVRTENLQGCWCLCITPNSIHNLRPGMLYLGFRAWPSLRFRYNDCATGRGETAIISFDNDTERQRVLHCLNAVALPDAVPGSKERSGNTDTSVLP